MAFGQGRQVEVVLLLVTNRKPGILLLGSIQSHVLGPNVDLFATEHFAFFSTENKSHWLRRRNQ